MQPSPDHEFPAASPTELDSYLRWLGFLRGAVLRKIDGLSEEQARWAPEGALLPLLGIVNHLTRVEWRWIDGGMLGLPVGRGEEEFRPGPELTVAVAIAGYEKRAADTEAAVRSLRSLDAPCHSEEGERDLRWVLMHLVNETARHAGHADATRELLDGYAGE